VDKPLEKAVKIPKIPKLVNIDEDLLKRADYGIANGYFRGISSVTGLINKSLATTLDTAGVPKEISIVEVATSAN
jgi:hypothetical protein